MNKIEVKEFWQIITNNYKEFSSYIDFESLKDSIPSLLDNYNKELNPNLYLSFILGKIIMKELCHKAKDNIDLTILIIDKYKYIPYLLNNHLKKYSINELNTIIEDEFIKIIDNYDGSDTFISYTTKHFQILFGIYVEKKQTIKEEKVIKKKKKEKKTLTYKEIAYKTTCLNKPNDIDLAFNIFNIINLINDPELRPFIELKFGYIDNKYFSLKDISNILNIPYNTIINYYQKCLNILKQHINNEIDNLITNDIKTYKNTI